MGKRVSKLLLPGDAAQFYPALELDYQPPLVGKQAGNTTIRNSNGTKVVFEYSAELLLTSIKHYEASVLKKTKQLTWSKNHWLTSVSVQDGNGVLYQKRKLCCP